MLNTQQLAERMSGIGGSEAAAACGRSPWMTPLELYMIKLGQLPAPDLSDNEAVHFGNVLEDIVANEWSRRTCRTIRRDARTLRSANAPFMLGHIDRRVTGDREGVECKTASFRVSQKWGEEDTDEMPEEYLFQNHHYLAITGWDVWHTAVLIAGNDFRRYQVERDPEMIYLITERERELWRRIELKDPPPPMSDEDCKLLWPSSKVGKRIKASSDVIEQVETIRSCKAKIKEIEATMAEPMLHLKVALSDASELIGPDGKALATYKSASSSMVFNEFEFALKEPDLWRKYLKNMPGSRRLLIK